MLIDALKVMVAYGLFSSSGMAALERKKNECMLVLKVSSHCSDESLVISVQAFCVPWLSILCSL